MGSVPMVTFPILEVFEELAEPAGEQPTMPDAQIAKDPAARAATKERREMAGRAIGMRSPSVKNHCIRS